MTMATTTATITVAITMEPRIRTPHPEVIPARLGAGPEVVPEYCSGDRCHGAHLQREPNGHFAAQEVVDQGNEIADQEAGCNEKREIGQPATDSGQPLDWVANEFPSDIAEYEQECGEGDDQ